MNKLRSIGLIAGSAAVATGAMGAAMASTSPDSVEPDAVSEDAADPEFRVDTIIMPWGEMRIDTVQLNLAPGQTPRSNWRDEAEMEARMDSTNRYKTLTDNDFRIVANELGVEVAAIKAVVRIEAGASCEGFWAPGVPVINFDRTMYSRMKATTGKKAPSSATVPAGIKSSYGRSEWSQLIAARKVNMDKANMGTFWGMFQIGGFNWKACGCKDIDEFVERMSYSEFEQLELFATFIRNTDMLPALKEKNWASFARKYNGASYAKRGYHTKMANAYARFKKEDASKQDSTKQDSTKQDSSDK